MRGRLALVCLLATLLVGCGSGTAQVAEQDLRSKAATLTDLMAQNEWAQVRTDFDATMRDGLSEDRLASSWQQVVRAKGKYESRGDPAVVKRSGDLVVFDTPMQFQRGPMKSRVTFHPDGDVAGLFILVPDAR